MLQIQNTAMVDEKGYITPAWRGVFQAVFNQLNGDQMSSNISLFQPTQLTTSPTTIYTFPNVPTRIGKLTACNTSGSAVTINIYLVPQGQSAGAGTIIISALSIPAGESVDLTTVEDHVISANWSIQASASTGGAITIFGSGNKIS